MPNELKARLTQSEIFANQQSRLNAKGLNIVTCGNCGEPFVTYLNEEEHTCPYCGFQSEPCDFPDLFH